MKNIRIEKIIFIVFLLFLTVFLIRLLINNDRLVNKGKKIEGKVIKYKRAKGSSQLVDYKFEYKNKIYYGSSYVTSAPDCIHYDGCKSANLKCEIAFLPDDPDINEFVELIED